MHINLNWPPEGPSMAAMRSARRLTFSRQRGRIDLIAETARPPREGETAVYTLYWPCGAEVQVAETSTTPAGLLAAACVAADTPRPDPTAVLRAAFRGALRSLDIPARDVSVIDTSTRRNARWEGGELW